MKIYAFFIITIIIISCQNSETKQDESSPISKLTGYRDISFKMTPEQIPKSVKAFVAYEESDSIAGITVMKSFSDDYRRIDNVKFDVLKLLFVQDSLTEIELNKANVEKDDIRGWERPSEIVKLYKAKYGAPTKEENKEKSEYTNWSSNHNSLTVSSYSYLNVSLHVSYHYYGMKADKYRLQAKSDSIRRLQKIKDI